MRAVRSIAYLPVGLLALVLSAARCGGASSGPLGEAPVEDSGAMANSGSGSASGGGGGTSGGGSTSGSASSGVARSGGSGGSGGDSGRGGGTGTSGSAGSGSPIDAGREDAGGDAGRSGDGGVHACFNTTACGAGQSCCGSTCCNPGQLCCPVGGPVPTVDPYYCMTPTAGQKTCPSSCAPKCVSDRNVKRDIEPVDPNTILESVARMPVSTWSYRSDDPSVRHLGPMAQDFRAAFGLGDTDRAYDPIDAHGVAFAAIKGLYDQMREQSARIERLERENEALRERRCAEGPLR
jgi:hypothetical protein